MADMANIVVKAANGTTDVTYSKLNPSSGDGVSALWRNESAPGSMGHKPTFQVSTRWNGPKTARRCEGVFKMHQTATDSTTGLISIVNTIPISFSALVPVEVPDSVSAEAVAQAANLFASALIKESVKTGFAPT